MDGLVSHTTEESFEGAGNGMIYTQTRVKGKGLSIHCSSSFTSRLPIKLESRNASLAHTSFPVALHLLTSFAVLHMCLN